MNPLIVETLYQEDLYNIPGRVMIIISKEWDEVTVEDKTQLTKILTALKLKLESVQILTRNFISLETLMPFSPSRIISFGVPFQPEIQAYETIEVSNVKLIYADALTNLDDGKKRNLWLALKVMFGL